MRLEETDKESREAANMDDKQNRGLDVQHRHASGKRRLGRHDDHERELEPGPPRFLSTPGTDKPEV